MVCRRVKGSDPDFRVCERGCCAEQSIREEGCITIAIGSEWYNGRVNRLEVVF